MKLHNNCGIYQRYIKRVLDIVCALLAFAVFFWLYAAVALIVRVKIGKPVLFKQPRPGRIDPQTGEERIFNMYKFRTMSDGKKEDGSPLPDAYRLSRLGRMLRATSLDELPEAFNILKGDMSVIGPRPQLVRDMVFMSDEQRMRHTVKPGLSGLAQINGRNAITWEEKLNWDLKYIEKISFLGDLRILIETVALGLGFRRSGVADGENELALDYGDVLLKENKVSDEQYAARQLRAKEIIRQHEGLR